VSVHYIYLDFFNNQIGFLYLYLAFDEKIPRCYLAAGRYKVKVRQVIGIVIYLILLFVYKLTRILYLNQKLMLIKSLKLTQKL
jgi:hypothetical protein